MCTRYADLFSYVLSTFSPWRDKVDKIYISLRPAWQVEGVMELVLEYSSTSTRVREYSSTQRFRAHCGLLVMLAGANLSAGLRGGRDRPAARPDLCVCLNPGS